MTMVKKAPNKPAPALQPTPRIVATPGEIAPRKPGVNRSTRRPGGK
jgi:hypothetical protein